MVYFPLEKNLENVTLKLALGGAIVVSLPTEQLTQFKAY